MEWLEGWPFRSSAPVTIALGVIGAVFFGALLAYSVRRHQRAYVPGLTLVVIASISELMRGLFGSNLSPHPATAGGAWRLINATLIAVGFVMYYRAWAESRDATAGVKRRSS